MPPASAWEERVDAIRAAGTVGAIADAVVERWLTPPFAAAHPELRDRLRAMVAESPLDGYAACCGALARMDLRPALAGIRAPTLVIGGDQDPSTPVPEHGGRIATAIPGARLEV